MSKTDGGKGGAASTKTKAKENAAADKPGAGAQQQAASEDAAAGSRDWSKTLFLPKTDFPMKAGLPELEPRLLARWDEIGLYRHLREAARSKPEKPKFVLHDGPPFANGHIHIGHALNKILKDLVVKSQTMLGQDSNYVPGWDCHGLPIEWKIEEQYRAKGRNKDAVPINEFRAECREFAKHWVDVQREEFKRLGIVGDWAHPYLTMDFASEAVIAAELMKFAMNGTLYRGSKPVMWSVVEKTALAEAEVEYQDYQSDQIWVKFPIIRASSSTEDPSSADAFDLLESSIVIWTTTPWTIPGNRAISFSSKIDYGLYEVTAAPEGNWAKAGDKLVLADKLADEVMKAAKVSSFKRLSTVNSDNFFMMFAAHPLRDQGYEFDVPLLDGDHVTDDTGTGFVHTAPGHGADDYQIWMSNQLGAVQRRIPTANLEIQSHLSMLGEQSPPYRVKLDDRLSVGLSNSALIKQIEDQIPFTVDADGVMTKDAPGFEGKRVLTEKGDKGDANDAVIKALVEANALIARGRLKHQYPHSWRSKKPVIFRNTPQWFIALDKPVTFPSPRNKRGEGQGEGQPRNVALSSAPHPNPLPVRTGRGGEGLRELALKAISETEWVPASGENRIRGMIEGRPDWVISRQRAWGVPITVFVKETGEVIPSGKFAKSKELIERIFKAFAEKGADVWYDKGAKERFLEGLVPDPAQWEQVRDILDVWFESGSTHAFVLDDPKHFPGLAGLKRVRDGGNDRIMYLEGSDQHRGWFQSSLLESCGSRGRAPFDVVLTHGFILDEKGEEKMSKSRGNTLSPQEVMKTSGADILRLWVASADFENDIRFGPGIVQASIEAYRKLRNTLRWMLGALAHLAPADKVKPKDMRDLELERLMQHRLAVLDGEVRAAYAAYDYRKVVAQLSQFMNTELSAFYFDIRKDALYCEPYSSVKRRATLTVIDAIFNALVVWLAPILAFTAEEAWLSRHAGDGGSVHLQTFPDIPQSWRDDALAQKWERVRDVRRVVTGALELERAAKRIGSSLEAAPEIYVGDGEILSALEGVDLGEVSITSAAKLIAKAPPASAFTLPDVPGVGVVPKLAQGKKCARSWRVVRDVGSDPEFPDLSARDAAAVREFDARAKSGAQ